MKRRKAIKTVALGAFIPYLPLKNSSLRSKIQFKSNWQNWPDMPWAGPEFWGNRLQDWEIKDGKLLCNVIAPNRNLHLLQTHFTEKTKELSMKLDFEVLSTARENSNTVFGFMIGSKGPFEDYRSAAVFGKGLTIGYSAKSGLIVGEKVFPVDANLTQDLRLNVNIKRQKRQYELEAVLRESKTNKMLISSNKLFFDGPELVGYMALVASNPELKVLQEPSVAFQDWSFDAEGISFDKSHVFGPICFAQYTLHNNILKLTAQLSPAGDISSSSIFLDFKKGGRWETAKESEIHALSRTAHFRLENWQEDQDVEYRLVFQIPLKSGLVDFTYQGTVAKEPLEKNEVKTVVFSCNFHHGFPDSDVVENVKFLDPDIILFLGDQFYEYSGGYGTDYSGTIQKTSLDYLRRWLMFGWSYRALFQHKPCAIIPDDHDAYHGNVWGEDGARADISEGFNYKSQDSGGYKMTAEWMNMMQYSQTSHLPDAFDPTPVKQGIGVYYTEWKYGGISFAILEDRKFKTAPKHVLPEIANIKNGWILNKNFDIKKYRNIDAELLGKRQEEFLDSWTTNWGPNDEFKVVLSQTNFATIATLPASAVSDDVVPHLPIPEKGDYVLGDVCTVDMDSNGWPQAKRDTAVAKIRKAFAFHIAGDQHLASFVQYGVDDFNDSGFAFAGPALNNIFPRRFWPPVDDASRHTLENPSYTGEHFDGFGNKINVRAVGNPYNTKVEPLVLHNRATGYGLVTFYKDSRQIKTECWSRLHSPKEERESQMPGWPIHINQEDNFGKKAVAHLPKIIVENCKKPVFDLYDSKQELVYSIRAKDNNFTLKVFDYEPHKVMIRNPLNRESFIIKSLAAKNREEIIRVTLG